MSRNITWLTRVRWRRHDSAESITRAWYMGLARSAGVDLAGFGDTTAFTRTVKLSGLWAFAVTSSRTVHYWAPLRVPFRQLVHMLGHELGHIVESKRAWGSLKGAPRGERTADLYGAVAARAVREAQRARGVL